MRTSEWFIFASLALLASCAHEDNDRPLTAAEKQRMIEAEMAREAVSEGNTNTVTPRTGCSNSTAVSRFGARGTGFSGADGFDTRGCNSVNR